MKYILSILSIILFSIAILINIYVQFLTIPETTVIFRDMAIWYWHGKWLLTAIFVGLLGGVCHHFSR